MFSRYNFDKSHASDAVTNDPSGKTRPPPSFLKESNSGELEKDGKAPLLFQPIAFNSSRKKGALDSSSDAENEKHTHDTEHPQDRPDADRVIAENKTPVATTARTHPRPEHNANDTGSAIGSPSITSRSVGNSIPATEPNTPYTIASRDKGSTGQNNSHPQSKELQRNDPMLSMDIASQAFDDTPSLTTRQTLHPVHNNNQQRQSVATVDGSSPNQPTDPHLLPMNSSFLSRFRSSSAGIFSTTPPVPSPLSKVVIPRSQEEHPNTDTPEPMSMDLGTSVGDTVSPNETSKDGTGDNARRVLLDQLSSAAEETDDKTEREQNRPTRGSHSTQITSPVTRTPTVTGVSSVPTTTTPMSARRAPTPPPYNSQQVKAGTNNTATNGKATPSAFVEKWLSPQNNDTSQVSTPVPAMQKATPSASTPGTVDPVEPSELNTPPPGHNGDTLRDVTNGSTVGTENGGNEQGGEDAADGVSGVIRSLTNESKDVLQAVSAASTDRRSCVRKKDELEVLLAEHSVLLAMGLIEWVESWDRGAFSRNSKELDKTVFDAQALLEQIQ